MVVLRVPTLWCATHDATKFVQRYSPPQYKMWLISVRVEPPIVAGFLRSHTILLDFRDPLRKYWIFNSLYEQFSRHPPYESYRPPIQHFLPCNPKFLSTLPPIRFFSQTAHTAILDFRNPYSNIGFLRAPYGHSTKTPPPPLLLE